MCLIRLGAGVHVQDSNLTINNGNFTGIGLRVENRYYDTINTISNGTFETIEYMSNYDDFSQTSNRTTRANIYGGSISNIVLTGTTFNEINLDGGTIGEIIFNSDSQATDVVNVTALTSLGNIRVDSSANNSVVFENNILPINTSLDLGLNTLYITNLTTQAGNVIQSTFSNNDNSLIPNSGIIVSENLNLGAGTQWTLVNSSNNPYTSFQDLVSTNGILLAQADQGSLTYNLILMILI